MAKPIFTINKGETIMQRPNTVRCRYLLKNGQLLSVFFDRDRFRIDRNVCYVWKVGIHIGRNRKEANQWYNHKSKNAIKQTGQCGLEGLSVALRYIRAFGENLCSRNCEMQISWADDKRMRAYKYLLRYPGFTLYEKDNKPQCIAYRNPELYEWVGENA